MATAKIQTVKGLRVEIFSRTLRKNTTRPLTVWIGGTDGKCRLLFLIGYAIISSSAYQQIFLIDDAMLQSNMKIIFATKGLKI